MNLLEEIFIFPIFNLLIAIYGLIGDLGLAIIAVTILVRLALLPLANKQVRAQRRLQVLQPELQKLQKKHKDDRETLARETMAFYKKEGVNPAASCLPLLVQLPFLIAIYFIFQNYALNDNHLKDLYPFVPNPGHINTDFLGIQDMAAKQALVLSAMAGIFQYFQSKMLLPKGDDPNAKLGRQMAVLFPIITFVFSYNLPSALALYWVTTTAFSIIQQYVVIKTLPAAEARAEGVAHWNKANPSDPIDVKATPKSSKKTKQTKKSKTAKGATVTVRQRNKK